MSLSPIDDRYKQANKVLLNLRAQFERLEAVGEDASMGLQDEISSNLNVLSGLSLELEEMVPHQNPARRELWRM